MGSISSKARVNTVKCYYTNLMGKRHRMKAKPKTMPEVMTDANAMPIWSQTRHSLHGIGKDDIFPVVTVPITFAEAIRLDRSIT